MRLASRLTRKVSDLSSCIACIFYSSTGCRSKPITVPAVNPGVSRGLQVLGRRRPEEYTNDGKGADKRVGNVQRRNRRRVVVVLSPARRGCSVALASITIGWRVTEGYTISGQYLFYTSEGGDSVAPRYPQYVPSPPRTVVSGCQALRPGGCVIKRKKTLRDAKAKRHSRNGRNFRVPLSHSEDNHKILVIAANQKHELLQSSLATQCAGLWQSRYSRETSCTV